MGLGGLKDEVSDGCGLCWIWWISKHGDLTGMVLNVEHALLPRIPVFGRRAVDPCVGRSIWPCDIAMNCKRDHPCSPYNATELLRAIPSSSFGACGATGQMFRRRGAQITKHLDNWDTLICLLFLNHAVGKWMIILWTCGQPVFKFFKSHWGCPKMRNPETTVFQDENVQLVSNNLNFRVSPSTTLQ